MSPYDYDMFLIGTLPAGQPAVIQAAKLGERVAIAERRTVDYFINNVFDYPTVAEAYKTAAFIGVNRLDGSHFNSEAS